MTKSFVCKIVKLNINFSLLCSWWKFKNSSRVSNSVRTFIFTVIHTHTHTPTPKCHYINRFQRIRVCIKIRNLVNCCSSRTKRRETMKIFGTKFTPLKVVLQQNLEMLVTTAIIWFTLLLIMIGYPLAIYLFFYSETLRYCVLFYFIWMYYDNYLHPVSGRR